MIEYFIIDARGIHIKIPLQIANKSHILRNTDSSIPYYLNYSSDIVHQMVDYLSDINDQLDVSHTIKKLMKELDIVYEKLSEEYFKVNARGTIIEIPIDLLHHFEVIRNLYNGDWKDSNKPYYLNYKPETVHLLISYLSGINVDITNMELKMLSDEMLINLDPMSDDFCEELKKKYNNYIDSIKSINELNIFLKRFGLAYWKDDREQIKKFLNNKIEMYFSVKRQDSAKKFYIEYYNKYINKS